ncbi:UDP-N-acetylmuramoyl-tripeptide--D-alanyl-D-alanine ligase [Fusibacter bizertensis]|jgi:UDP-N-acetylmuramyl pentapeptide synthase|uniref:UDP-N-acetylmuramoyl-tripeptide--D-alanyl-D-alanine ligase n=1 Tax=Fusibacter bizertensis TaxID=1488331 RepID=A0ABT6NDQ7_9FIRM|nr:UDP-N-acetylmuramoyl-tripeptide--D-alanyl-D-alanine ligase [Fusibacter bizertensis]MDH8678531.1 UDP-N-acetylmuramoyl-tripeptide--D-alanyl-D-alanine ligase [Fusibacter bizertensis]
MLLKALGLLMITGLTFIKNFSDVHKFQQYGYYMNQYLPKARQKLLKPYELIYLLGIILVFVTDVLPLQIFGLAALTLNGYFYLLIVKAYPAKKKCVYTPRVKRMLTTSLILLAITAFGMMFLPNWSIAIYGVVIYPMSFVLIYLANTINKPIEGMVNNYYYKDALRLLSENPNLTVIGVTGSYGKTSTKNVLYTMLSKDFNVLMTPESFNTKMGLTRTIREHLKPTHQILIAEMGAKEVGDIKELCDFVKPHYGVITSIGPQHLDTFKTFENVILTKGELFKYLQPNGTAFVNIDDENIRNIKLRDDVTSVRYSVNDQTTLTPDYYIEATSIGASGSSFTLVQNKTGKKLRLNTKLLGRHNLSNVLAGIAISLSLGVSFERLGTMTADLTPVKHRLSTRRVNDQYTILDDAFNSNPVGSKMALEVLKNFEGNKKIVITPGMIELGDQAYDLNKSFGIAIADACDYVILVGKKQTAPIQDGLAEKAYPSQRIYIASSIKDGFNKLHEIVALNDVVLIENDLPDTFNE